MNGTLIRHNFSSNECEPTAPPRVKTANTRRRAILRQEVQEGLPLRYTLPLSALLVALMTWGLYHLQTLVKQHDHLPHVRPFGIGYLVPVILMTVFAKRRAGWITLLLSLITTAFALIAPAMSWQIHDSRDCVELVLLTVVGGLVVSGVEAMQQNRMMFAEITDAPYAQEILDAVRSAVCTVPLVGALHSCVLRRRGFDIYVDLDFYLASGAAAEGLLSVSDAGQVVSSVETAVYQSHPLIFYVRARFLPPPSAPLHCACS